MSVETMPPARAGGTNMKAWLRKNKLLAGGAAVAGGFLYLSKKGGGNAPVVTTADDSVATTPLPDVSDYGGTGNSDSGESGGETGSGTTDPSSPADDGTNPDDMETSPTTPGTVTVVVQTPQANTSDDSSAAPQSFTTNETAKAQQGITLAGKFFAGATSSTMTGSGSNEYGSYMIHAIKFPGRTEYWWHYTSGQSSGKWTGPHTSGGSATTGPTVTVISAGGSTGTQSVGSSGTGGGGGGGGGKEQPKQEANVFYNSDRNLRYIIQNKKTSNYPKGHNFRGYESRLNKGDWGSSAGPGWIPT